MLIEGGNIVSQNIQFEDGVMEGMEVEVGGNHVRVGGIRRMLNRCEVVNFILIGHNHHASRMLAGGPFNPGAALGKTQLLRLVDNLPRSSRYFFT